MTYTDFKVLKYEDWVVIAVMALGTLELARQNNVDLRKFVGDHIINSDNIIDELKGVLEYAIECSQKGVGPLKEFKAEWLQKLLSALNNERIDVAP